MAPKIPDKVINRVAEILWDQHSDRLERLRYSFETAPTRLQWRTEAAVIIYAVQRVLYAEGMRLGANAIRQVRMVAEFTEEESSDLDNDIYEEWLNLDEQAEDWLDFLADQIEKAEE